MVEKLHYSAYVNDDAMLTQYDEYQERYRDSIRESDKILIALIRKAVGDGSARLLDIGCSTGNLLRHIRRLMPNLALHGGDLSRPSIERCRADPELSGIDFRALDMLKLSGEGPYDVIVANAIGMYFEWTDYETALRNAFTALAPGGSYIAFEWLHPFQVQDLKIVETSEWHPEGLSFHFRPIPKVEPLLHRIGFSKIQFLPFVMPIDLPMAGFDADVTSYTRRDEHGSRLAFRGALYQPWCHLVASK